MNLEPLNTNLIEEIFINGEEIHMKKPIFDEKRMATCDAIEAEYSSKQINQKSSNTNKDIINEALQIEIMKSLKASQYEINCLISSLNIARGKKVMELRPITNILKNNIDISKLAYFKRKFINRSGQDINKFVEKCNNTEYYTRNFFYQDLINLAHKLPVVKSNKNFIGDLSYRLCGSNFWHPGAFEIKMKALSLIESSKNLLMVATIPSDLQKLYSLDYSLEINRFCHLDKNEFKCLSIIRKLYKMNDDDYLTSIRYAQLNLLIRELIHELTLNFFNDSSLNELENVNLLDLNQYIKLKITEQILEPQDLNKHQSTNNDQKCSNRDRCQYCKFISINEYLNHQSLINNHERNINSTIFRTNPHKNNLIMQNVKKDAIFTLLHQDNSINTANEIQHCLPNMLVKDDHASSISENIKQNFINYFQNMLILNLTSLVSKSIGLKITFQFPYHFVLTNNPLNSNINQHQLSFTFKMTFHSQSKFKFIVYVEYNNDHWLFHCASDTLKVDFLLDIGKDFESKLTDLSKNQPFYLIENWLLEKNIEWLQHVIITILRLYKISVININKKQSNYGLTMLFQRSKTINSLFNSSNMSIDLSCEYYENNMQRLIFYELKLLKINQQSDSTVVKMQQETLKCFKFVFESVEKLRADIFAFLIVNFKFS